MPYPTHLRATKAAIALLALTLTIQAQEPPTPRHSPQAASDAYLAGARALERSDAVAAEQAFVHAAQLDPGNPDYAQAILLAHEHRVNDLLHRAADARLHGHPAEADALLAQARTLDPLSPLVAQHAPVLPRPAMLDIQPQIKQGPAYADAIALTPDRTSRKSFHIRGDTHRAVTEVEQAFGIKVQFDESTPTQQLRFDLEDVTYAQAVPVLFAMTHVFGVPLDAKTLLIAKETTENHTRLDRMVQETIYIPGQSTTQVQDIANIIRNIFDVKLLSVQTTGGSMVLRTTSDTLKAINIVLSDLLEGGADVVLQMQIYSVDITHSRDIGFQPPQFGAYNVSAAAQALVNANQTLVNQAISQGLIKSTDSAVSIAFKLIASGLVSSSLLSSTIGIFGGTIDSAGNVSNQFTTTGITETQPFNFNLKLNASEAHALEDTQARIGDSETATFRSGSRYPITTSTYSTPTASSLAGVSVNGSSAASLLSQYLGTNSTTTIPQISYEDLGLTLKATPRVQIAGRVYLHLDLKLEALGGSALNNIPILNSRTLTSDVTVADGESALLVSTLSRTESSAVTGLPGFSELPGFQVPTEQVGNRDTSELVILITPHVIRHRAVSLAGPRIAFNVPPSSRTD